MITTNSVYQLLSQSGVPVSSPGQPVAGELATGQKETDNSKQAIASDQEARDTAKKFESLLIHTMLKNMRAASSENPLINSDQLELYNDMFDQQISKDMASNGSFGVADVIYRQLTANTTDLPDPENIRNLSAIDTNSRAHLISHTQSLPTTQEKSTPQQFIDKIRSQATTTAQQIGTSPETIMAIAALETGWGNSVPLNPDGSSSNNLFGIKADSSWTGPRSISQTNEFRDGTRTLEYAAFRSYPDERQSIEDFGNFLQENPRYQQALSTAGDAENFVNELQRAGYATDPKYANKVISVMQQVNSNIQ